MINTDNKEKIQTLLNQCVGKVSLFPGTFNIDEPGTVRVFHPDDIDEEGPSIPVRYQPSDFESEDGLRGIVRALKVAVDAHTFPENLYAALNRWAMKPDSPMMHLPEGETEPARWAIRLSAVNWFVIAKDIAPDRCKVIDHADVLEVLLVAAVQYNRIDILSILETQVSPCAWLAKIALDLSFTETAHNFDGLDGEDTAERITVLFNEMAQTKVITSVTGNEEMVTHLFRVCARVLGVKAIRSVVTVPDAHNVPYQFFAQIEVSGVPEAGVVEYSDLDFSQRCSLLFFIYRLRTEINRIANNYIRSIRAT